MAKQVPGMGLRLLLLCTCSSHCRTELAEFSSGLHSMLLVGVKTAFVGTASGGARGDLTDFAGVATLVVGATSGSRVDTGVVMAQSEHNSMAERNIAETSDATEMRTEEITAAMERLTFLTAKEEPSVEDCASSSSDPAQSSSEYFSSRIQLIMESRDKFETALEAEIEASRVHWSELRQRESEGQGCAEANMRTFRSLQRQYAGPKGCFFVEWNNDHMVLGEKIAEGGQGAIYGVRSVLPELAHIADKLVMKVFKLEGWSLEDLQKLWPPGMLLQISNNDERRAYGGLGICVVGRGVMLKDGSFGFLMLRFWGDLRKAIDVRMQHNGNQAPPFSNGAALRIMYTIAVGMRGLHVDGIVHRDLKASNVLIFPDTWDVDSEHAYEEFNITNDENFRVVIADFECSVGVVGTGFWRAPEILLGLKNRCLQANTWTEKVDVYSYGMTCYEILTGKIPFEHLHSNDYGVVLEGGRPTLPSSIDPRIQALLVKCWHHDLSRRPSFLEIVDELKVLLSNLKIVFANN